MPELDHLIFASPDLAAGVDHIRSLAGAEPVVGGPHPGHGSCNELLTFDDRTYFEIIGIDPEQPDPSHPRPFGLDDLETPKLVGYAIHPVASESLDDVVAAMRAAGMDPGSVAEMSRRKPDGELLSWTLTRGGDSGAASGGALPFAIDWGASPSPATTLPSMGQLVSLTVSHPDAAVRASAEALGVAVDVIEGPAALVARVETPSGLIEIR